MEIDPSCHKGIELFFKLSKVLLALVLARILLNTVWLQGAFGRQFVQVVNVC